MGSIYLCGSEEQKQRWLPRDGPAGEDRRVRPDRAGGRLRRRGRADHHRPPRRRRTGCSTGRRSGSGTPPSPTTSSSGPATPDDGQVKGFVVEKGTPGLSTAKMKDKIALRVVQNAYITLDGCRVPEANRLQEANSFRRHRRGAAADPGRGGLAGRRLRPRRVRARAGLRQAAAAVRPADRRLPARAGPAGAGCWRTSPPRPACAPGCPQLQADGPGRATSTPRWPRRSARCGCGRAVGWARELLGGNGILLEHQVGRFVADAEAIYSYEGTREINTLIVGRAITGLDCLRLEHRRRDASTSQGATGYLVYLQLEG